MLLHLALNTISISQFLLTDDALKLRAVESSLVHQNTEEYKKYMFFTDMKISARKPNCPGLRPTVLVIQFISASCVCCSNFLHSLLIKRNISICSRYRKLLPACWCSPGNEAHFLLSPCNPSLVSCQLQNYKSSHFVITAEDFSGLDPLTR